MNNTWSQNYEMFGLGLWGSALVAAIPIFVLLLMLGVLRKPAWMAAVCGLASALLVALFGYGMPASMAIASVGYGAAFALFPISWIIVWAIVLYRLTLVVLFIAGQFGWLFICWWVDELDWTPP